MVQSILNVERVDFFNLLVVKSSNFILVATIFFIVRQHLDSSLFIEFGFYWGTGLLVGALLFGGFGSTLVRFVSLYGGIGAIGGDRTISKLLTAVLVFIAASLYIVGKGLDNKIISLLMVVSLGMVIQLHLVIMSLFRAVRATRELLFGGALMAVVIPSIFIYLTNSIDTIETIFRNLTISYLISLIILMALLAYIARHDEKDRSENIFQSKGFKEGYLSFTMVTVFSNLIILVDFYFLREMLSSEDLAKAGVAKIYFDRFVLPLLSVMTGAISLNILRSKTESIARNAGFTTNFGLDRKRVLAVIPVLLFIFIGYYVFIFVGPSNAVSLSYLQASCVILGYVVYSFNSIFLDILVIKFASSTLFLILSSYLIVSSLVYYFAISTFSLKGWVSALIILNLSASYFFFKVTSSVRLIK